MPNIMRKIRHVEYDYSLAEYALCCNDFKAAWLNNLVGAKDSRIVLITTRKLKSDHRDPSGKEYETELTTISYCPFCGEEIYVLDA